MKTKDLIKLLQEEDPTGESFVRLNGGAIRFVEGKAGYWDGAYQYLDEKGNFVQSTKGSKVDIYTEDLEDFVWELVRKGKSLEAVKSKTIFQSVYEGESLEHYKTSFYETVEKYFKEGSDFYTDYYKEGRSQIQKEYEQGFRIYIKKDSETSFKECWTLEGGKFTEGVRSGDYDNLTRNKDLFEFSETSDREGFGVYLLK